ncbi:MAG: hypothetical protein DRO23_09675 [Thermoprotei archaeon]|nr:MAG: hypothetical protein DRO23_09675 [Thermoprotei archaeon]
MVVRIPIKPKQRWEVVFKDNNRWQCGIYVPEFTSKDQVTWLEKHDGPELFYLVEGSIVLVLSENGKEIIEVPMEENTIYIVNEWHNAYRPKGVKGVALVIEKTNVKTEFLKLK